MALVQIARFEDPNEGEIAANALRAEGIETVFNNQGLATTDFLLRTATGGYPLWVLSEDEIDARKLLRDMVRSMSARLPDEQGRPDDDEDGGLEDGRRRRRRFRLGVLLAIVLGPPVVVILFLIGSFLWSLF